jgi:hypothetical protein
MPSRKERAKPRIFFIFKAPGVPSVIKGKRLYQKPGAGAKFPRNRK